jgi:hypothetical protein
LLPVPALAGWATFCRAPGAPDFFGSIWDPPYDGAPLQIHNSWFEICDMSRAT